MASDIIIRKAQKDDLETLLRFEQGVITAERPFDPTLRQNTVYYDLSELLTSPDAALMVAVQNGVIVGSGYARIEKAKSYLQHEHHAYLGFMYTDPAFRGQGINKRIVEALAQWSISKGVNELRLDVYAGNEPAIKAYEKAGFVRHMIEMRMHADDITNSTFGS